MKETDEETAELIPSAATNNDTPEGGQVAGALDPRIRIIAKAIGRHVAREHMRAWEEKRQKQSNRKE